MQKRRRFSPRERVVLSLAGLTVVSASLFIAGAIANRSLAFSFMLQNLFFAWVPFGIMVLLLRALRTRLWSIGLPLALTLFWLVFLPNSFYMISDFVHIQDVVGRNLLYDVVMFTSCIF